MTRNEPKECAVFGIDIGKALFHVVGLNERGAPVQKAKFRRVTLLQFFERARPTVVGMEACPGSQWLARKLLGLGHDARIIPVQFVKPYVKSNKTTSAMLRRLRKQRCGRPCASWASRRLVRSIFRCSTASGGGW